MTEGWRVRLPHLTEILSIFTAARHKPVSLSVELPSTDITLIINVEASSVKLEQATEPRIDLKGTALRPERVRFKLIEEKGGLKGILYVEDADVIVRVPFTSLGVVADSAGVKVHARVKPLRYVSVKVDASSVAIWAKVAQKGGIYLLTDSSAVKAELKPEGSGEYWAEVEADSSGVKVMFEGEKIYIVEGREADASRVVISRGRDTAPVKVKVRVKANASTVKFL
jgi:hypothetical protein